MENGRSYSAGLALAIFLISRRSAKVNFGGRPPYFGYSEPNPSALKLRITSRTRSSLVKATLAIPLQPAPWGACRCFRDFASTTVVTTPVQTS